MTDTPEVNDIPAILARAKAATSGDWQADQTCNEGESAIRCWTDDDDAEPLLLAVTFRPQEIDGDDVDVEQEANAEFIAHSRTDVPNMAAEILSLRAQVEQMKPDFASSFMRLHQSDDELLAKKRLDVLEELLVGRWLEIDSGEVLLMHHSLPELRFDSFTEAADAELLSRREKENG